MTAVHPLSLLSADEVSQACAIASASGDLADAGVVVHVILDEPDKQTLAAWQPGDPVDRRVAVLVLPGPELTMVELLVSLSDDTVVRRRAIEGMRPALLFGESFGAIVACMEHPDYIAAMARRGITDLEHVQIDPWPAGSFGYPSEQGRRIARCISFVRETADDNGPPGRGSHRARRPRSRRGH